MLDKIFLKPTAKVFLHMGNSQSPSNGNEFLLKIAEPKQK